ncbi:MAG: hypothetical protein OEZ19_03145 [Paracoccaceae bacterium]|nr:hypothetical protein [Paracoccaceae bacterium]
MNINNRDRVALAGNGWTTHFGHLFAPVWKILRNRSKIAFFARQIFWRTAHSVHKNRIVIYNTRHCIPYAPNHSRQPSNRVTKIGMEMPQLLRVSVTCQKTKARLPCMRGEISSGKGYLDSQRYFWDFVNGWFAPEKEF